MAIKKVKKGTYQVAVAADAQLVLSVTIGNEQAGGNVVELEGEQIAKGRIKRLDLGSGADLKGKKLRIVTNVLDVNPSSNLISVRHFFYNGNPAVFSYPESGDDPGVDNDGDIYSLSVTYKFA